MASNISYMGKGVIYTKKTGGGLIAVGNCSKLDISFDEEKKELKNYMTSGGGVLDSVSRITGVKLGMTSSNFSAEALSLAMRGTVADVAGGAVTDEAHNDIYVGAFVPFNKLPDLSASITVKKATVVQALGTAYTVTTSGIIIVGGTLVDGDDITVSYTALTAERLEAITDSGQEYELVFDGLNEARSGKQVRVTAYRIKFSPMKGFGLIADDFGEYEMEADILADLSKSGAGISQYFKVEAVA
jgi:hypothetical protein